MSQAEEEKDSTAKLLEQGEPADISEDLDRENWVFPESTDDFGGALASYDTGEVSRTSRGNNYPVAARINVRPDRTSITFSPQGGDMRQYENIFSDLAVKVDANRNSIHISDMSKENLGNVLQGVERMAQRYADG